MTSYSIVDSPAWAPPRPDAPSHTVTEWRDAERDGSDPRVVLRMIAANTVAAVLFVVVDGQPGLREYHRTDSGYRVTYTVSVPAEPHEWLVFDLMAARDREVARFDARLAVLRWRRGQLFDRKASASASSLRASASRSSG